jgi:hypothetical protein
MARSTRSVWASSSISTFHVADGVVLADVKGRDLADEPALLGDGRGEARELTGAVRQLHAHDRVVAVLAHGPGVVHAPGGGLQ